MATWGRGCGRDETVAIYAMAEPESTSDTKQQDYNQAKNTQ
jgi:hypothetical protein